MMSRQHYQGRGPRRLARERTRHILMAIACAILVFPTVAAAEVCDKVVGEHWRPGDGPAWSVTLPGSFDWTKVRPAEWAVLLGVPCMLACMTLAERIPLLTASLLKWVGYLATGLVVIVALYAMHVMIFLDGLDAIHALAAKEGCIGIRHDWQDVLINGGVMALIVSAYVLMAMRMKRFERSVEARHRRLVAS